jgi:SAM-dependent methyltransferase
MTHRFDDIRAMYRTSYERHGDSSAALLTPKGRSELRFRALLPLIDKPGLSVLDYGCGLGYLYEFLEKRGLSVRYTGLDILPEFVEACQGKYGDRASFQLIDVDQPIVGRFDLVFASGVFNIRTHQDPSLSEAYATARLKQLFAAANVAIVCDFLSPYVDFKQADSQHFGTGFIADFTAREISRRFIIRHDLLPYEYTLLAWRDDAIRRPHNIFEADA